MNKEQILDKHLKLCIKNNADQNYNDFEDMKKEPEYKAVLDAMSEMETELVKNNAVLHGVSGCLSQDELIDMLDDKRVVNAMLTENAWYLVRKQAAEYLLDICHIKRK
jgi:hypothetical protein